MAIAITPAVAPIFVSPTTGLSVPVNGDALDATFMKTSVEQPLLDATDAARLNLIGGGVRRRVLGTSSTSLTIQPLGAVTVETVAGVWTTVAMSSAVTIDPTAVFGAAFVADTRYWLYATISAGAIAWHISTTAPDVGFRFKTGDTSKLYISTFIAGDAGAFIAYKQSENYYEYLDFALLPGVVHGNKVLSLGNAIVATSVSLSPLAVPVGCTSAKVFAQCVGIVNAWVQFYPFIGSPMYTCKVYPEAGAATDWVVNFESGGNTTTEEFAYIVDAFGTTVDAWVQSFIL